MASDIKVGFRVKHFRDVLKMTIDDLSTKSGISSDVIESIEKGEVVPAVSILAKLARSLGQRLGTFTDDQFLPDPIITRNGEGQEGFVTHTVSPSEGYVYHSLAFGKPDRHMDPFRIDLEPNRHQEFGSHEGEELLICASGEVELFYGSEKIILKPGDTAYYNTVVKHGVRAVGDKKAVVYAVIFMPY